MTTVTELQQAILGLSDAEYTELIRFNSPEGNEPAACSGRSPRGVHSRLQGGLSRLGRQSQGERCTQ